MGFLHEGHLSLVRQAHKQCASVVVSIFVNPTQFGPNEDLGRYPRDLERDKALLAREGVHVLWTPLPEQMYPLGYQTWVTVDEITSPLEGAVRPGHFRGVTTVVAKIFNAVQPDKAFFGQKDAQQAAVIRRMSMDLNFPVQIVVCPTVREPDGLAKSSRNVYLNPEERKAATVLYRSLSAAKEAFEAGERDAEKLRRIMGDILAGEALAQPQYVSCADPLTLKELDFVKDNALLSMAVYIGATRLIDNMMILKEK
jgi:pantoate--beta-alanine ligase